MTLDDLENFVTGYIDCAIWTGTDEAGRRIDDQYDADDLSLDARSEMAADCEAFVNANLADLARIDASQAGHDFWMSRNGHGAGFWDRGHGEVGNRLHKAAKVYGSQDLYVGDDK